MAKKKELSIEEKLKEALIPKEEQPYELPAGWEWVKIGKITEVYSGGTPSTSNEEYYLDGDIPWISPKDLSGYEEKYIERGNKNITTLGLKESSARLLPKGTVLLSSRAPIGYVAIAKNELSTNQGFKNFGPSKSYNPEFLYYYLKNSKGYLESIATGTTFKELSGQKAAEVLFPLPPIQEQNRITEKLDSMLGKVKEAKDLIAEARETFETRRASILNKAFRGELTEKWRNENPSEDAMELLEKINEEKLKRWEDECSEAENAGKKKPAKPKLLSPEEMLVPEEEQPYELPDGWRWIKLGNLFTSPLKNGYSPKACDYETETKTLKLGAITRGFFNSKEYKYIDETIGKDSFLWLKKGDFLIQRSNSIDYVGMTAVYDDEDDKFIYPDLIMKARIAEIIGVKYIVYLANSKYGRKYFLKNATGTAGNMPKINQKVINDLYIPLASKNEIKEILKKVEELLKAEEEASDLLDMEDSIELLEKSILDKAFRGELGTSDLNDEPAIEMLRRIL